MKNIFRWFKKEIKFKKFNELKWGRHGDTVYRVFPDFKAFQVSFITGVQWSDEIREYQLIASNGDGMDRILYPLVKSIKKPLIRVSLTIDGSPRKEIYSTDPNFRHFYETDRKSKLRRLHLGD